MVGGDGGADSEGGQRRVVDKAATLGHIGLCIAFVVFFLFFFFVGWWMVFMGWCMGVEGWHEGFSGECV